MAGKLGLLLDKIKRQDGEASKCVVVVGIVIGVLIAGGLFFCGYYLILSPSVDSYISDKPISHLYDFYDLNVGQNETAVYFVGNSQIGADVYIPLVQSELRERGYPNISLYNIYRSADSPIRRLSQTENIIESRPSLIIYGISPWIFTTNNWWVDEDEILVSGRQKLNSSANYLYSKNQLDDIYSESANPYYMKRFFKSALTTEITKKLSGSITVTDPITYTTSTTWDPWTTEEKRTRYSNTFGVNGADLTDYVELTDTYANTSRNGIPLAPFVGEKTQMLLAFEYILQRFADENIPVVLVIMPNHSILNDNTPAISETNFRNYVKSTGLDWYDLDEIYGDEIMADLTHVNWDGAVTLAPKWADIVIQEFN